MSERVALYLIEAIVWLVAIYIGYLMYRRSREKYRRPLERFPDMRPYLIGIASASVSLGVLYLLVAAIIVWMTGTWAA